jgi:hypothetical protein
MFKITTKNILGSNFKIYKIGECYSIFVLYIRGVSRSLYCISKTAPFLHNLYYKGFVQVQLAVKYWL